MIHSTSAPRMQDMSRVRRQTVVCRLPLPTVCRLQISGNRPGSLGTKVKPWRLTPPPFIGKTSPVRFRLARAPGDPLHPEPAMIRATRLLATAITATAALTLPLRAQVGAILVRGGTIHTAAGAPITNGSVLIRDGKIVAVGTNVSAPAGARIIDATGKTVIPGMIDNHSHIGAKSTDLNDSPMLIGPQHRFLDALDWNDPDFQDAMEGGVTTIVTGPGSGENVSGMAVVIKTFGTDYSKRMLLEKGGMKFAMGPKG